MGPFVGVVEIVCGALVIVGLFTRLATLLVTMERSTSAFSRLNPPTPQPARRSAAASNDALMQAERKTLAGRLSMGCAMRDNRQSPSQR